ncbi:MAG: cysteine desulfurase family protein [Patescibacteria group bacterium]|nr:cysteine desulfurase family protein [Patescibacteria group bacterium]
MNKKIVKNERIYFDNSATTPMDSRVISEMKNVMESDFGNPSSIHSYGREARGLLDKYREVCRDFIGADEVNEIIFTSGGSEADNLAILGLVKKSKVKKPHIITSLIEHKAVLETIQELEKKELIEATYLKVDKYGQIDLENVKREIRHNTILISVMYVNNEVGTIQPVREIGKYLEKINEGRVGGGFPRIYLHTDAVQAFPYLKCNVKHLHIDMMSVSAHKFNGPKGTGFLYVKEGTPVEKIIYGGAQEFNFRAGTENMSGIAGLAKAVGILAKEQDKEVKKITELRDKLIKGVLKIKGADLTGHKTERSPAIASFVFSGIEGESILINLDLEGIAVSTGSACSSGTLSPSHVLMAMGYSHVEAQGNIRVSLGRFNTEAEVKRFLDVLPGIVERLRDLSPLS